MPTQAIPLHIALTNPPPPDARATYYVVRLEGSTYLQGSSKCFRVEEATRHDDPESARREIKQVEKAFPNACVSSVTMTTTVKDVLSETLRP